ncbi:MAG: hypothetical protein ACQEUT_09285 [Bacillota bacterium]
MNWTMLSGRGKEFNRIINQKKWIIEGVLHTWTTRGFQEADVIIYLNTPMRVRTWRILKRFTVQKLGFEKGTIRGCSKSPVKLRISPLACFSVPHILVTYVPVLKAGPPRTSWSFLSSILNTHYKQTWSMLKKMYQWNYGFEKSSKPEIMELLKPHEKKVKIFADNNIVREITQ